MKLYVVEGSFSNRCSYEDYVHGSKFIGVYESLEKAQEAIRNIFLQQKDYAEENGHGLEDLKKNDNTFTWSLIWRIGEDDYYDDWNEDYVYHIYEVELNQSRNGIGTGT